MWRWYFPLKNVESDMRSAPQRLVGARHICTKVEGLGFPSGPRSSPLPEQPYGRFGIYRKLRSVMIARDIPWRSGARRLYRSSCFFVYTSTEEEVRSQKALEVLGS